MNIQQKDDGKKGSFYIEEAGVVAAEMTYVWAGTDRIIIDHTEVSEVLKGKSAGKQMLLKALDSRAFATRVHELQLVQLLFKVSTT